MKTWVKTKYKCERTNRNRKKKELEEKKNKTKKTEQLKRTKSISEDKTKIEKKKLKWIKNLCTLLNPKFFGKLVSKQVNNLLRWNYCKYSLRLVVGALTGCLLVHFGPDFIVVK